MRILWTPPDGPDREFAFRVEDLGPEDYEPIEEHGAWASVEDFDRAVRASSRTAWRVALWICLRRETPGLALADVRPKPYELVLAYEPAEQLLLAEAMLTDPDLPADQRAMFEATLPDLRAAVGKGEPSTAPAPWPGGDELDAGTPPTS